MERLTEEKQLGPFASLKDKAEAVPGAFGTYDCFYAHEVAVTRLKEYEDIGMTPEEIKEFFEDVESRFVLWVEKRWGVAAGRHIDIMRAERAGRLVLLPCKVTDTVFIVETVFENGKQKKRNKPCGERVVSAQIDHVTIGGTTGKPVFDLCSETGNWYYALEPGEFFLTREEAEDTIAKSGEHT